MIDIIKDSAPWVAPFLAGAFGQVVGFVAGYNVLVYRVKDIEKNHEACKKDRKKNEETMANKIDTNSKELYYIKGRMNGSCKEL